MNKFEKAYVEFLKEQRPMKNVTPAYVGRANPQRPMKNITNAPGSSSRTISPASSSSPSSSPSFSDRLKGFGRKLGTAIKNVADDPGPIATGLAKIGGYDAREYTKELDVRVNNTARLRQFISQPVSPAPEGASDDYFYKQIDIGTPEYNKFVEIINNLNPEAADRFESIFRKLDATKQNYIEIKSSLPGLRDQEKVLIGKIGNSVYAYYPKPVPEERP